MSFHEPIHIIALNVKSHAYSDIQAIDAPVVVQLFTGVGLSFTILKQDTTRKGMTIVPFQMFQQSTHKEIFQLYYWHNITLTLILQVSIAAYICVSWW